MNKAAYIIFLGLIAISFFLALFLLGIRESVVKENNCIKEADKIIVTGEDSYLTWKAAKEKCR